MNRCRLSAVAAVAAFVTFTEAHAAETLLCAVSYQLSGGGMSRESFVTVTFMSGSELGMADIEIAGTFVEWSGRGNPQLSQVEYTRPIPRGHQFHRGWLPILFTGRDAVFAHQIEGDERRWRIRALDRGQWIDPKLTERRAPGR